MADQQLAELEVLLSFAIGGAWAEYEFATTEYDYRIHPDAAKTIRTMFRRLAERG